MNRFRISGMTCLAVLGIGLLFSSGWFQGDAVLAGNKEWAAITVPSMEVLMGSEQSGQITSMPVKEGEAVTSGQELFQLNTKIQKAKVSRLHLLTESEARIEQASEQLRYLRDERIRLEKLTVKGIAADTDLRKLVNQEKMASLDCELAKLNHATTRFELAEAEARLAQRTIQSPCNGMVTKLLRQQGEVVDEREPVIEVVALDPLWIEFDCPIQEDATFQPGRIFKVTTAARPGNPRKAKVVHLSMKANPASHTFRVRLAMENKKNPWKAGLKVLISPMSKQNR